jgi:membrane fusion protein, copper/silver efflux system
MLRKATYSCLLVVAIAAAFFAGTSRGDRDTVRAAADHGRRVLYYVDPMHPDYKSDKPGIAPDCNMALEPVYADPDPGPAAIPAGAAAGTIAVDAAKQQAIGVRVGTAEQKDATEKLRLFGRVAAAETKVFKVNTGLDGYVREISEVTTGSQVHKYDWLATYSSPEIRQPVQGYLATLESADREARNGTVTSVQMAFAKAGLEQYIDRLITLGMSRPQIDEITKTRVVPADVTIAAPADGFVIARNVTPGEKVQKGTELYRIADIRQVWVLAEVVAQDAPLVKPGMTAEIALAGRTTPLIAHVSRQVLPQFNATTQYYTVRFDVDNPEYALRPDMLVDVDLQVRSGLAMTIPADAIVRSGLRNSVFVERSAGVFEPRDITVGRRSGDRVQVVSGLSAGERIAISGTFLLDSESRMHRHDQ